MECEKDEKFRDFLEKLQNVCQKSVSPSQSRNVLIWKRLKTTIKYYES